MRRQRKICALICIFSAFWSIGLLAPPAEISIKKYRIGLSSNFSGVSQNSFNPFGSSVRNGARLALTESKTKLKDKGVEIELIEIDYGSHSMDVQKAVFEAKKNNVSLVVGYEFSDDALVAAPLHVQLGIPMFTPSASADRLGEFGPLVRTGSFLNSYQGRVLANWASKKLKAKTAFAVVAADCAYCQDMMQGFDHEFSRIGGKVTKKIEILSDAQNLKEKIPNFGSDIADVIFVPNHELTSAAVIRHLLKLGYQKPFLGGDGWRNLGKTILNESERTGFKGFMTGHWHAGIRRDVSQTFVRSYKKRYGMAPTDSAALVYDTMGMIVALASSRAIASKSDWIKYLNSTRTYEGVTGTFLYPPGQTAPQKTIHLFESTKDGFKSIEAREPFSEGLSD